MNRKANGDDVPCYSLTISMPAGHERPFGNLCMPILKQQHQVAELLAFLLGMQAHGKRLAVAAYICSSMQRRQF